MKFEETGLQGKHMTFEVLDEIMDECGFDRAWDYERATYDYKMVDQVDNSTYYFRIPCFVIEGEIPKNTTRVELMMPYVGKHYYPHGVEYDEEFPQKIIDKCLQKANTVAEKVDAESL